VTSITSGGDQFLRSQTATFNAGRDDFNSTRAPQRRRVVCLLSTLSRHSADSTTFQLAVTPESRFFQLLAQICWVFPIPLPAGILLANAFFLFFGQPV
jgi:hypothetical protein